MKKLMILGGGIYQVPLIQKAKEMNIHTIAASYPGPYPGLALADQTVLSDTRDYQTLCQAAREYSIDGICTTGTDVSVHSLGYICQELGLCGVPLSAARLVTNKAAMKEAFLSGGVSTGAFFKVHTMEEALQAFEALGTPAMIKAVDSSGSRGITKVEKPGELASAFSAALSVTKKDYVLVEEFIEGNEIGVDGFVADGKLVMLLPHDKFTLTRNGTTLPAGHRFPFACSYDTRLEIQRQMELVVSATGMDNCAINADVIINEQGVFILEAGGRAGATCIPELISIYAGFDYYKEMIHHALGEPFDFSLKSATPCMAKLLFSPVDGVITSIHQEKLEAISKLTGISCSLDFGVGDTVEAVINGTCRIGQVIMETDSESALDAAFSLIQQAIYINNESLERLWIK